jgi:hypothetical protein
VAVIAMILFFPKVLSIVLITLKRRRRAPTAASSTSR